MSSSHSRSRGWCFTLNQYTDDEVRVLSERGSTNPISQYLVFGFEVGDSGTPHLQGYVYFKSVKSFKQAKAYIGDRAHVESQRGSPQQAAEYCKKDGNYQEFGDCPYQGKRTDLEVVTELVVDGVSISEIAQAHPTTFVKFSRGLRDLKLAVSKPYAREDVCGIWLVGEPGSGKSHYAQTTYPCAYRKAQNKWFDGYAGEKEIVLEDLDSGVLSHHLKIWADKWPCTGETKGGTVHLTHDVFVVTSNYTIDELVPKKITNRQEHEDDAMIAALARRFKVFTFNKVFVPPDVSASGSGHWYSQMTDPNGVEMVLGLIN